jgi:hypothetical protein
VNKGTRAVDIKAELAGRPVLHNRTRHTSESDAEAAFATLAPFHGGGIFAGSFFLDGATTLTIIIDDEPQVFEMTGGMLVVVPRGCWHRFQSQEGVTVLTMTPQPTEHTVKEDPRD